MKLSEKIFKIKFLIIFSFFFSISVKADNHNIYETLELIKKDLKTLERAVYSGSNPLSWSKNRRSVTVKAN